MNARDPRGRFDVGNPYASIGGRRRAAALTPDERKRIARLGHAAMIARHFGGDAAAAGQAAVRKGNGPDVIYFGHTFG